MIIPSLDIQGGRAVQLRQGRDRLLTDPRDPVDLAAEFGRYGPVAVVDLDAALGTGDNRALIRACCRAARCRVGGGIRTEDQVRDWIRAGAEKVMIGTRAEPDFLRRLPRDWLIGCLDARGEAVVTRGWTQPTGRTVLDTARTLAPHCGEFLFTQVEREGMLAGGDLRTARALRAAVDLPVTVAGGLCRPEEIRGLEEAGLHSQIGLALYAGSLDLALTWVSLVRFDAAGLVPTIVQDDVTGAVLMLGHSNAASLHRALTSGAVWLYSRSRQTLWEKGATSGNRQHLIRARWDCDRDTVLFEARPAGPACHRGTSTCFDAPHVPPLVHLTRILRRRHRQPAPAGSYTRRLLDDAALLAAKLREETEEVIEAEETGHVIWECADLLYHLMVRMEAAHLDLDDVARELRARFRPSASGPSTGQQTV